MELASSERDALGDSVARPDGGFRLAMIPEPSTGLLVIVGLLGLAYRRSAFAR
jgi:hypothetical protein